MDFSISHSSKKPIYEQIITQIKRHILSGALNEGDSLPSIRLLAKDLRISVITTKRAYDELEREGLIYSLAGKGTFVAKTQASFLEESVFQEVEERLREVIDFSKEQGISLEKLTEILTFQYEEES